MSDPLDFKIWNNIESKKSLLLSNNKANFYDKSLGLQLIKKSDHNLFNITLNHVDNKLTFDQSRFEISYKNVILGIGKINRNYSFSPNTSLILSKNARPSSSAYFSVNNLHRSNNLLFSWAGPWSFEAFNSILSNTSQPNNPMLLGMRAVIEPINNFQLEFVKTSQWGGAGYSSNITSLTSAIIGNTNSGNNSNINQVAGFGFSYKPNLDILPARIYAQIIGEDEAGNLPSCLIKLYGIDYEIPYLESPTKIYLEYVDTRIEFSKNKNCGPNTAYNNATYKYINYDKSLGTSIDTEGKSISIGFEANIQNNIEINYSISSLVINDNNWLDHRLSSSRQQGWLTSIGVSKNFKSFDINGSINYQSFALDKESIKKGLSVHLSTEYNF